MGFVVRTEIWGKQEVSTQEVLGKRVVHQVAFGGGASSIHGYPSLWRNTKSNKGVGGTETLLTVSWGAELEVAMGCGLSSARGTLSSRMLGQVCNLCDKALVSLPNRRKPSSPFLQSYK